MDEEKFLFVGNHGHKAEGAVAMRKTFFCVGNHGHTKDEGTVAMRKSYSE